MAGIVEPTQVKIECGTNVIQTGDAYDWNLTHIIEDTFMVADVQIGQYANKDGGYFKKRRFQPREIVMYIQSKLNSAAQIDATWLQLRSYMNAKRDGAITLYKHGVVRTAPGAITSVRKRDEDSMPWNVPADIRVVFTCPDPWLLSEDIEKAFSAELPLFMAPFSIFAAGYTPSVVSSSNSLTFYVNGDDDAGFLLTLTATGACVNPKISNADGDYIRAIKTMADGDVITIKTGTKPYVKYNGSWCPRDKVYEPFLLTAGAWNTLTITADSGEANLIPEIKYAERYQ